MQGQCTNWEEQVWVPFHLFFHSCCCCPHHQLITLNLEFIHPNFGLRIVRVTSTLKHRLFFPLSSFSPFPRALSPPSLPAFSPLNYLLLLFMSNIISPTDFLTNIQLVSLVVKNVCLVGILSEEHPTEDTIQTMYKESAVFHTTDQSKQMSIL